MALEGTIDNAFENIHNVITEVIDKFAPYESYMPRKYMYRKDPWIPVGLLTLILLTFF